MLESRHDRSILPVEQRVLLWCMRGWAAAAGGPETERRPQVMLGWLGAADATPHVEGFMAALSRGAARRIGVSAMHSLRISADEQALLDAMALAQAARPFEALLLLRGMLTPAGAQTALRYAQGIGTALARAGWTMPAPDSEISRFGLAAPAGMRPEGAATHYSGLSA